MDRKLLRNYIFTIAKYLYTVTMAVLVFFHTWTKKYTFTIILEVLAVLLLTNLLAEKKVLKNIVNDVLMLLINIQVLVLYFANSYITIVMLTNVDSLEDLSGKVVPYSIGVILVLFFSFIPATPFKITKERVYQGIAGILAVELLFTMIYSGIYSPLFGYVNIYLQKADRDKRMSDLDMTDDKTHVFYKDGVGDYISKPSELGDNPNVVLVMTEGLSQNVIDDERVIMPNVKAFQDDAITFRDYYNHSFATYRGIIGQLYSGFQMENYDDNTLISIEEILREKGYYTCFINTEPNNEEFTEYLESLEFDEVIGEKGEYEGKANSLSDKQAYETLYNVIEEAEKKDAPYFVVIYTFGTHLSLDSPNETFEKGDNPMLNKFYDTDYQFGQFFNEFKNSSMSDNTLFVFTADHCTYGDQDFQETFPNHPRYITLIDSMPLSLWYKGVEPQTINVNGKNSLNLAPTIMDMIDVDAPNYFLGTSLYNEAGCYYDSLYECTGLYYSTKGAAIRELQDDERNAFADRVNEYFLAKTQEPVDQQ